MVRLLSVFLLLFLSGYVMADGDDLVSLRVGEARVSATIAMDEEARRQGLMWRKSMARDEGILLIYPSEGIIRLWMLNTYIPLDVGFFDRHGVLVGTVSMEPDGGKRLHNSPRPAMYALEMNRGWFKRNKIELGARLQLPKSVKNN